MKKKILTMIGNAAVLLSLASVSVMSWTWGNQPEVPDELLR